MSRREEFEVGANPEVDLSVEAGRVSVSVGAADRIIVRLDGGDSGWEVEQSGSLVTVYSSRRWRTRSTRVEVEAPEGCRVNVRTASADVRLSGRLGDTRVKTASGDVDLEALDGLHASTASGDVHAGDVSGDVEIGTVSGDVRLGEVGGRVAVTTTSGDIVVRRIGGDLGVHSVSGDVRVERFDGDDLTAKSVSGDLDVGLPGGIRVSPEIATLSGQTRLPERRPNPDASDASTVRRRVRLAFKSVSGSITVRRVEE